MSFRRFLIIAGLILLEVILQPLVHIGYSYVFFLPVLIMTAGAHSRWYEWVTYVASLSFVAFYIPYSPLLLFFTIGGSYGLSRIFSQWSEDAAIRFGILSSLMTLLLSANYFLTLGIFSYHLVITIILNLMVLGVWFLFQRKKA
jgi:hypothetical protein